VVRGIGNRVGVDAGAGVGFGGEDSSMGLLIVTFVNGDIA
jgi:hypothetical protein